MLLRIVALALAGAAASAAAQLIPDVAIDWKEIEAPPPPALRTTGLVPVEVPGTSLRFGIDPASITVGADQVVRYVVVASSSSGAVNGIYEGIRCSQGQVKIYARHNPGTGWSPAKDEWRDIYRTAHTRYSLVIAKSGICMQGAPNGTPAQMVRDLRLPPDRRFERGGYDNR